MLYDLSSVFNLSYMALAIPLAPGRFVLIFPLKITFSRNYPCQELKVFFNQQIGDLW